MINPHTAKHFTAYKKLQIVRDYQEGKDVSEIMAKEAISQEELDIWVLHAATAGVRGLRAGKVQDVRRMEAGA